MVVERKSEEFFPAHVCDHLGVSSLAFRLSPFRCRHTVVAVDSTGPYYLVYNVENYFIINTPKSAKIYNGRTIKNRGEGRSKKGGVKN